MVYYVVSEMFAAPEKAKLYGVRFENYSDAYAFCSSLNVNCPAYTCNGKSYKNIIVRVEK